MILDEDEKIDENDEWWKIFKTFQIIINSWKSVNNIQNLWKLSKKSLNSTKSYQIKNKIKKWY